MPPPSRIEGSSVLVMPTSQGTGAWPGCTRGFLYCYKAWHTRFSPKSLDCNDYQKYQVLFKTSGRTPFNLWTSWEISPSPFSSIGYYKLPWTNISALISAITLGVTLKNNEQMMIGGCGDPQRVIWCAVETIDSPLIHSWVLIVDREINDRVTFQQHSYRLSNFK